MIKRYSLPTDELVPVTQEYYDNLEKRNLACAMAMNILSRMDYNTDRNRTSQLDKVLHGLRKLHSELSNEQP